MQNNLMTSLIGEKKLHILDLQLKMFLTVKISLQKKKDISVKWFQKTEGTRVEFSTMVSV